MCSLTESYSQQNAGHTVGWSEFRLVQAAKKLVNAKLEVTVKNVK